MEVLHHERLDDHSTILLGTIVRAPAPQRRCSISPLPDSRRRGLYAQALADVEPTLALVAKLPDGSDRLRAELGVRLTEMICAPVYGFTSDKRLHASQRVCELSERLCDTSAQLRGLVNVGLHTWAEARHYAPKRSPDDVWSLLRRIWMVKCLWPFTTFSR
jgi:hypothetical protein